MRFGDRPAQAGARAVERLPAPRQQLDMRLAACQQYGRRQQTAHFVELNLTISNALKLSEKYLLHDGVDQNQ